MKKDENLNLKYYDKKDDTDHIRMKFDNQGSVNSFKLNDLYITDGKIDCDLGAIIG